MNDKIISSIDISWDTDHIDKNKDNLKKAIRTMPISTMDKIDLDNSITDNIKSLDFKIHDKVNKKIENHDLTEKQEFQLDWIISELASKSNDLVINMISSLDNNFPNNEFIDIENNWMIELSNILDGIKFYDKKKVNKLSETEKLLASNDIWWFANAYKKNWSIWWMVMSIFK